MKTFVAFLIVAVAAASASHLGLGIGIGHGIALGHGIAINPAAHIPSGSISVGPNGATVAGPAGSVSTDNGLHSGRAGARLAGPAGTVAGWGAHGIIEGPAGISGIHGGLGHGIIGHVGVVAPVLGHGLVLGHGIHGHGIHGHGW